MAKLVFQIQADYDKVIKLRNEIAKLKQELKGMDSTQSPAAFKTLNTQLAASTQQLDGLVSKAAQAGAEMENGFKKKIFDASQSVNGFTEKIIAQKAVVKDVEADVKRLGDAYRTALKRNPLSANSKLDEYTSAKKALDEEKAALFGFTQEQANARLSVKKLRDEYALYKNDGKQVIETTNGIAISWKKALGVIGGAAAIKKFISDLVNVRGEFQKTQMSFETMLGSKEKADKLMAQMVETAAKTPFDLQGVADGAKQLLAYGTEAKDVNDTLIRLGNIASGLSIPLGDMVYLYGTTQTQGRLFTQDVRQFMGRGIPLVKELATMLGKTEEEINKMVTAGQIGFPQVEAVIKKMTDEGGKFYNLMQKQSETLSGQISNLGDAWDRMLNSIGEDTQGLTSKTISMATSIVENYETVGKVLAGLIATYGTYRTAVMLVTAAESKHTLIEIGLTNVRVMARKAQLALNAAMLTNPYVLLATAVIGLGAAMWAFRDSTTAAEKGVDRYNKEQEKAIKLEDERKQKIDGLIQSSRDIALSDLQRGESLAELRKEYPKIFEKYDIETIKLADILKLKQQIAEEDAKRAGEKVARDFEAANKAVSDYEKTLTAKQINGGKLTQREINKRDELRAYRDEFLVKKGKGISEQFISSLKEIDVSEFDRYISELENRIKGQGENGKIKLRLPIDVKGSLSDEAIYEVKDIKTLIDTAKSTKQTRVDAEKNKTTYQEDLAKAKSDWEKAKKGYELLLKDQKATSEQVKNARDDMQAKEKSYKDLGGVTDTSKQESAVEKLRKEQEKYNLLLDKQGLERQRQQEDIENQVTQAIIDAKSDGYDKIQAQRELDNKKEIQSLKRQKEDMIRAIIQAEKEKFDAEERIKAQQVKGYKIKGFEVSSVDTSKVSSSWDAIIKNSETKQGLNEWEQREASMNEYLLKYGTFSQKKEAIDKKYLDAIEKETDLGKKNTLQKEWDEALANLDLSKLKQEINWEMVFGDLSKVTKEQLSKIKKQLQEFKQSDKFKNATPEQIQVIEGAINSINDAMVDKGGFFGGMVDSVTELKKATEELKKAEEELTEANKNGTEVQKEEAQKKVNQARNRQQNAETNVTKSSEKTIQHLTDVGNAIAQLGSDSEMSLSQFGNAAGSIVDAFTEAGSKIGGLVGAIFSVLEGIQKQGLDGFVGNVLGNVAGAVGGILDTITFGAFGFRGADYSGYQKMKEQYDNLNAIWDELIDKKKEYIEMSYGAEANKVGREALELAEKSIESYRILGRERLNSGASMGSHSIGKRMVRNTSASDWQDIANAIGMSLNDAKDFIGTGRMTGLFDLTAEQLEKLKGEAPTFWAKMDSDVRDYLNSIIEGSERIENIQNQVKEQLTQVSFDSVFDSFVDTLMDMDSSAENFADNFEKYMQRAVLTTMVGDKYKAKLQAWYDSFAKANDDEAGITKEEMDKSQKEWDAIVAEAVAERDKLKDLFGWTGNESSSQSATNGGFQTMSQDTGSELNGRFTAFQISNEEIKNQSEAQSQSLNLLTAKADAILSVNTEMRNIADDTRDLIANSYLELVQISENTGAIVKPIQQMQKDIAEVKKNTEKL